MPTEADTRIVIDRLLREAGWDIENKSYVSTEEPSADGRADYLLKNHRTQPLAVVEAKRFSIDPYSAKQQTKAYAVSLAAPFILLSNGREHYFWDYENGDARPVLGFATQADLERRANLRLHRRGDVTNSLLSIPYPSRFRFKGEDVDARPYQIRCLQAADDALISGRRRMLFEMATGTGKTLTIAMLMKRWFQAAAISRVLFLADRIELAKQAKETFEDYLRDYPTKLLYGGKRSLDGQIVVGTLDTIAGQLDAGGFGHAYFDLVVTDECHRSIYNTHRATLAHFDAVHVGLTATPNPGELRWISEHERQLVRSTYMFFDCWDSAAQEGRPTFAYTLRDGIREGYLADYKIYVAESRLTFEGTTWEDEEIAFSDWGRTAESEDRLKLLIDEYFRIEEERAQPHPRKTIVFAVGERQATIIERLFNKFLPDAACLRIAQQINRSPAEVRQSFAQKITCYSNNCNPKPIIDRFKFDPLPVIAVSVDMLDTGYDHKEVENLVMLRPTTSAIKYAQMRGRGSRLCPRIGKTEFLIYDFVNNTANFDDPGQQYHRPKRVGSRPRPEQSPDDDDGGDIIPPPPVRPRPLREFTVISEGLLEDDFRRRQMMIVGPEGLAIDRREYQDRWRERIKELQETDPAVQKILAGEELSQEEWEILGHKLNAPEFWFDEPALRKAFEQPTGSLSDFIRAALGLYQFPTREQRIERAFNVWVAEHSESINPDQARMLRLLRNVVLATVRETKYVLLDPAIFSRPPFTFQGGRPRAEALFGRDRLAAIMEELNNLIKAT
ncbi:MAG: DEAD/DEAH box helicase family protein [Deltaproteobacteria bacterium]|nr:DEAD/DEAH box helicase family protein [Deltaproteobacteria bacterium]